MARQPVPPARAKRSAPVVHKAAAKPAPAPPHIATATGLLDIDDAIALLRTSRPTFYRWLREGKIRGDRAGKQWRFRREDLERFLAGETPRIDLPVSIAPLVDDLGARLTALRQSPVAAADALSTAVERLLQLAIASRGSDVHLDYTGGDTARVRLRIDGVLHDSVSYDRRLHPAMVDRLKIMAACNPAEHHRPQDGRASTLVGNDTYTMRMNFLPALLGESVTIRLWTQTAITIDIRPHLPRRLATQYDRIVALPWGMVLVVGPTGSGKTTTLYSVMQHTARPGVKVISIEDPVEYQFPGIVQVPVNPQAQVGFAQALRGALRADPDVIMIGELRDRETIEIAQQAALTGHLILAQMHTAHAAAALTRLVEIGSPAANVSEAVKFVLAQRLVRRVCPECSRPTRIDADTTRHLRQSADQGGLDPALLEQATFREAVGCAKCGQTGYRGRLPVMELLEVTPPIAAALRQGASSEALRDQAVRQGMITLHAEGLALAAAGKTTLDEVSRVMSV